MPYANTLSIFHDRREPDERAWEYRQGMEHGQAGAEYYGYGGRGKAANYGAGYKAGVSSRIAAAVEAGEVCPSPGCGKRHRSAEAAVRAHQNSPFPGRG